MKKSQEEIIKELKTRARELRDLIESTPEGKELSNNASQHPIFNQPLNTQRVKLTKKEIKKMIEIDNIWVEEMRKIGIK